MLFKLTHFSPRPHFHTPWKRQKTYGFLTFSGGIKMWHWTKMGLQVVSTHIVLKKDSFGITLFIHLTYAEFRIELKRINVWIRNLLPLIMLIDPRTHGVNWTYSRCSEDVLDIFWSVSAIYTMWSGVNSLKHCKVACRNLIPNLFMREII